MTPRFARLLSDEAFPCFYTFRLTLRGGDVFDCAARPTLILRFAASEKDPWLELFDDRPEAAAAAKAAGPPGAARLRLPVRDGVKLEVCDLDGLIDEAHPARLMWAYASRVDFSDFEARVKARAGEPGMAQASPHLLLALWLHATSRGVGSARQLARARESEAAYRWLCGWVGVNQSLRQSRPGRQIRRDV